MDDALAIAYLSPAWAEAALKVMQETKDIHHAMDAKAVSVLTIILDAPPGCYGYIYAAFKDGGLAEHRVGMEYEDVAPKTETPTFVVSGPYHVFAALQKGELSERKAILTGALTLEGSWGRVLRHMKALETITKALRTIECQV